MVDQLINQVYVAFVFQALNGAEGTVPPGRVYKKVAIVENFFDIIHAVHVDLEGRPGKHAGQKRTYRTVSYLITPFRVNKQPLLIFISRTYHRVQIPNRDEKSQHSANAITLVCHYRFLESLFRLFSFSPIIRLSHACALATALSLYLNLARFLSLPLSLSPVLRSLSLPLSR